jgi:hypothetical protein
MSAFDPSNEQRSRNEAQCVGLQHNGASLASTTAQAESHANRGSSAFRATQNISQIRERDDMVLSEKDVPASGHEPDKFFTTKTLRMLNDLSSTVRKLSRRHAERGEDQDRQRDRLNDRLRRIESMLGQFCKTPVQRRRVSPTLLQR